LNSIDWPLLCNYWPLLCNYWPLLCNHQAAQRSGDSAAMRRIRLEGQRERAEWALARG
jgi:hypothetical protein